MSENKYSVPRMTPEAASRRIELFRERFGQPHLYFACHAAFPLALTPNLLYKLWANFQRDAQGKILHIPWIAVADLLLSNLCEEVGYELYEMDKAIRNCLLNQLKVGSQFGSFRLKELSNFILTYVKKNLDYQDPLTSELAQVQQWAALAYVQPSEAARQIASALLKLERGNKTDWIRIASLIETFVEPLADFEPLFVYSRGMRLLMLENEQEANSLLSRVSIENQSIKWKRQVEKKENSAQSVKNSEKPRLLVVDDEPDNLDLIYRTFRREFQVFQAGSGPMALELLNREGEVAIIISDQRMPEMKGVKFLKRVIEQFPDTIRIVLTGFTDTEDLVDAINDARTFKYITKPWDPTELKAVVYQGLELYNASKIKQDKLTDIDSSRISSVENDKTELLINQHNHKLKLLLVDDEADNLGLLYRTFRREFQVFQAESGSEALELLDREGEMAIIISDQRMPEMKGVEFLGRVAKRFPDTIRIVLTGFTDVEDLVNAINQAQVFKYITKPWSPDELRAIVGKASQLYLEQKKKTEILSRLNVN